ncbi:hypothetical protein [Sorangium sp. So ce1335]|uniref:hypothetical protein n=1 Tax=Sorangium sp. So ce1335 TaxID=3133335 RepID=UPI003F642D50
MNRLAYRGTIAALTLLAAACGGSSDDTPAGAGGGTTASGSAGGGTTASGGAGGGTTASGGGTTASSGEGGGTTTPESKMPSLEIVDWNQDASEVRVRLILKNEDTLPLPVTPSSFSIETTEGFSIAGEPFHGHEEPCGSVNLASSASLRCEMGFSKREGQEPARLLFAALDGRQAGVPFPAESPITPDNFCEHVGFGGDRCYECAIDCGLVDTVCSSEDDYTHLDILLFSGGPYCAEGVSLLSEACYDGLLACVRGECADRCEFQP